jgi:hypothetical protein
MRRVLNPVVIMMLAAGCTLDNQGMPSFSGPSGLGVLVNVTATPDVIPQDGASQSTVRVSATDGAGQPLAGMSFATDGFFEFQVVKAESGTSCPSGTFSVGDDEDVPTLVNCLGFLASGANPTITTGSDGQGSTAFRAPGPLNSISTEVLATVRVTPLGGSFGSSSLTRTVLIKLAAF